MIDSIASGWQRGASTMTCREVNDSLIEYESGELAPDRRRELELHVLHCVACAAYLRSYQRTLRDVRPADDLLNQLAPPEVPHDLVDAILDATVRATAPSRPRRS
jgi:anti-sigma factor RsiW